MRTRFKKVWCASCGTMQFAGECPHGRVGLVVDQRPGRTQGQPFLRGGATCDDFAINAADCRTGISRPMDATPELIK